MDSYKHSYSNKDASRLANRINHLIGSFDILLVEHVGTRDKISKRVRRGGSLKSISDDRIAESMVPDQIPLIKFRFALHQLEKKGLTS